MPIAAAIIAAPSQPKTVSHLVSVNITALREAVSIIIAMIGAATPLVTGGRCDGHAARSVCLISFGERPNFHQRDLRRVVES